MPEPSNKAPHKASKRDFLSLYDLTLEELRTLMDRSAELKSLRESPSPPQPLRGKVLGMIFEKASTRTRVSFEAGIFERRLYQSHPDRYEYRLTEKGRDLHTLILSLHAWGKRWITNEASTLVHQGCGHVVEPAMVCPECSEVIAPNDLTRELAPAATH